ncbi:MAG: hypothetical protein NC132_02840 [Corallococcus sp.]|nr:hypothetical protein [Corallococcus sp.]MCM1359046.1 hypothetical protein [Corallococcus sp.]MCM1395035.1 hypothetical protein [Corallococcus sp.]
MRIKILSAVFAIVLGLNLSTICLAGNIYDKTNSASADAAVSDATAPLADETVTMQEIAAFLNGKNEHYPLSDEFIERYQQTSGGYIATAKTKGLVVDKTKHEPNQKWHFFDSWLYPSIDDGTITWDADAKKRVYTGLLCPELLLWIYEASGVDPVKVKAAKEVAEQGKSAGTNVSTTAKNMRACVPWEDIADAIKSANAETSVSLNPKSLSLTEGQEATVTATVISDDTPSDLRWSVTEGADVITITPSGNQATVKAVTKGTAKIKASLSDSVFAECTVTVREQGSITDLFVTKYNFSGTSTAQIKTVENAFAALVPDGEGDGIVTAVSQISYVYGGGSGGSTSSGTNWKSTDMIKLGTGSVTGSITFTLSAEVNRIKITGYVGNTKCEIRVGDGNSTDWTDDADDGKTTTHVCSDMKVIGKDALEEGQPLSIYVDFHSTSSVTIATINTTSTKYPLYITSIEFFLTDAAQ